METCYINDGVGMIDMKRGTKWIKQEWSQTCTQTYSRLLPGCTTYMGASYNAAPRPVTYTFNHFSAMLLANMEFIIVWKVAGKLVSPKNITVSSNRPSFVMMAAFHSSPSLICTLLYPQRMLNLVYREHPLSWLMSLGIRGSGYVFRIVHWLTGDSLVLGIIFHLSF